MSISLASDRGNTRKGGNSASLREPGHIANIRHKPGTKGIPHAAHSYDSGIFRELGSQSAYLQSELLQRFGDGVQCVNSLPGHNFGQGVLWEHSNQILRLDMDLNSPALDEVVATLPAPFAVTRGKVVMLVLRKQPICQEIVAKSTHFWLPS